MVWKYRRYKRRKKPPRVIHHYATHPHNIAPRLRRNTILRKAIPAVAISVLLILGFRSGYIVNTFSNVFTGSSKADSIPATEAPATEDSTILSPSTWDNAEIQKEAFRLINKARVEEGLKSLMSDTLLQGFAKQHCLEMKDLGYSPHTGFSERADAIAAARHSSWVAENVGVGYDSAESLVNGWLNSPEHRSNMLNLSIEWAGLAYIDGYACLIVCD